MSDPGVGSRIQSCAHPMVGLHQQLGLGSSVQPSSLSCLDMTPSETTPLLTNPPDHPSEEQQDNNAEENLAITWMFWEESQILAKYSLSVFG